MLVNSGVNIFIWTKNPNGLSFLYVFTNVYRSTFPVMQYTNTGMFEICSPFLERSLSTVAEFAFTLQLSNWFKLHHTYKSGLLLFISAAEVCCWIGTITGKTKWHVAEESIWCVSGLFLYIWLQFNHHNILNKVETEIILGLYIIYMFIYDIPLHYYRPNSSKTEILICEHVSKDIDLWKDTLVWMTGYFTMGSWISLYIA